MYYSELHQSSGAVATNIPVFVVVIYGIRVVLDKDTHALFENPKVEQTEMSYKYLCCATKSYQSHMEFHVQKKLIENNNMSLVAVSFAFIGKMIKAIEFFVQDSVHKHYFFFVEILLNAILEKIFPSQIWKS